MAPNGLDAFKSWTRTTGAVSGNTRLLSVARGLCIPPTFHITLRLEVDAALDELVPAGFTGLSPVSQHKISQTEEFLRMEKAIEAELSKPATTVAVMGCGVGSAVAVVEGYRNRKGVRADKVGHFSLRAELAQRRERFTVGGRLVKAGLSNRNIK